MKYSTFLMLIFILIGCKKDEVVLQQFEPFVGEYRAKGWVDYPEKSFPNHTILITQNGKYRENIEGSARDYSFKIKKIEIIEPNSTNILIVKLSSGRQRRELRFIDDTLIVSGIDKSGIGQFSNSPFYFIKK